MRAALEQSTFSNVTSETTVIINPPKRQPTWTGFHAPAVVETSTRRRMNSCGDVREIYSQCLAERSSDDVCKAAASYLGICTINSGNKE